MQQTTYYKLSEPEYGENIDVALINGNMDVIDTALNKARLRDAALFSENQDYFVGEYAIYQDDLYRCITATTAGAWDISKWTKVNLANRLRETERTAQGASLGVATIYGILPDEYDEDTTYNVGDLCMNGALYRCIATTTGAWDSTKWQSTNLENEFERKHTWKLLETITADGNTKRYDRNITEPISGLFITFEVEVASASDVIQIYAWFGADTTVRRAGYINGGLNTAARYSHIRYTRDGNLWMSEQSSAASATTASTTLGRNANGFHITSDEMARFRIDTNSLNFPSGSKITIYVRQ